MIFLCVFFLEKLNLKQIGKQKLFWGSGGMLHRKIFENLHRPTVMGILALFKISNANFVLLSQINPSPNILHFVRTFSIYAWLKVCLH